MSPLLGCLSLTMARLPLRVLLRHPTSPPLRGGAETVGELTGVLRSNRYFCGGGSSADGCRSPLFLCSGRARRHASLRVMHHHHPSFSAVHAPSRAFVEHDTNPTRWRNAENDEVRRQYKGGIPLHSQAVKEEHMKAQQEAVHAQRGDEMHWKGVHGVALGVMLFLLVLQLLPDYVDPSPSPEYVPYEEKEED